MLENWPQPAVIGHRGACALAPENTLASFALAMQQGADAIEFDVKLTADDQVVIMHDASVDRTTNGKGKVNGLSLAEIKELDAGGKYSSDFSGENVPMLSQVFEQLGGRIRMNVELTNYSSPFDRLVPEVCKLVNEYQVQDHILFSSFFARNLHQAKRLLPDVPCGLLAFPGWMGYQARRNGWRKYQALHPFLDETTPALVEKVHQAGMRVHVWTVNEEADLKRLLASGVDGIFTDNPGFLRKILATQ